MQGFFVHHFLKAISIIYTTYFKKFLEKHSISPNHLLRKVLALQTYNTAKPVCLSISLNYFKYWICLHLIFCLYTHTGAQKSDPWHAGPKTAQLPSLWTNLLRPKGCSLVLPTVWRKQSINQGTIQLQKVRPLNFMTKACEETVFKGPCISTETWWSKGIRSITSFSNKTMVLEETHSAARTQPFSIGNLRQRGIQTVDVIGWWTGITA